MATLISAGVSVTVTDESFYVPVTATTIPIFFVATGANKTNTTDGSVAVGTAEHGVIRTITSIPESVATYGEPVFQVHPDDLLSPVGQQRQFHGDARNEYGLFALNQFLELGSLAYVVRADIDLTETSEYEYTAGTPDPGVNTGTGTVTDQDVIREWLFTTPTFVGTGNGDVGTFEEDTSIVEETWTCTAYLNITDDLVFSVTGSVSGVQTDAEIGVAYANGFVKFQIDAGSTDFVVDDEFVFTTKLRAVTGVVEETWTLTAINATTFSVYGSVSLGQANATVDTVYDNGLITFLINDSGLTTFGDFVAGDTFEIEVTITDTFPNLLGADDTERRSNIVAQLQAVIRRCRDARSEIYEHNLIVCPGYHETADELIALSGEVFGESFVIGSTPMNKPVSGAGSIVTWAGAIDGARTDNKIAYYYPHGLASNLNGANVVCDSTGIVLKAITNNDNIAYVWFAPAGVQRGNVTGIDDLGYVRGTLGKVTEFVSVSLNQGQRDNLYKLGTNVNPIGFFPGRGMIVFGQKTRAAASSALDRINVVRLVMFLQRNLRKGAFPFLFEPNDQRTRDNLKAMADGFLADVMVKRGLYDFATVCDLSNNTSVRIDRNELVIDCAIKPIKSVEFIYIPIRVLSTGADI